MKLRNKVRYPSHTIEVFKGFCNDFTGGYRWRVTHKNGLIVAASTEGYKKRSAAISNLCVTLGIAFSPGVVPRQGGFAAQLNLLGKVRVHV